MGFLRRDPDAVAVLAFHERPEGRQCAVRWAGDESLIPHLTSPVLDKILANMSTNKRAAGDLLDRFEGFVAETSASLRTGDGPLIAGLATLHDTFVGVPDGEMTVRLLYNHERQNFGAITDFRPRALVNGTFPELALWTCWDWTCAVLEGAAKPLTDVVDNLAEQCAFYRQNGLPRVRTLGRAPFYAMAAGSGRRLRDEIGAEAGMSGDDLMELSEEERDELIAAHTERSLERAAALSNPEFSAYIDEIFGRFNGIWATPKNPIIRYGDEPSERELAIIKRVSKDLAMRQVLAQLDVDSEADIPVDEEKLLFENRIGAEVMACGYLWREAERGNDDSVLDPVQFAVDFMREQGQDQGKTLAELLDMAVMWTMQSFASLGYDPPSHEGIDGDVVLDAVFPPVLDWVCETNETTSAKVSYMADELQTLFRAGVALREVEPHFVSSETPAE
jgi:hypothetical protein